jgi:hypothetical protein
MDPLAQETIDYVGVRRVQQAYADIVTRRAWSELHDVFLPDITVVIDRRVGDPLELVGPQAVGDFISTSIAELEFFEFVILNTRIWLRHDGNDDVAVARMYINELRHHRDTGRWTHAYGIYHDRYQRIDGRWWFARRRYHSLARTGRDFEVFAFPAGDLLS